jgi:hypothetical protein
LRTVTRSCQGRNPKTDVVGANWPFVNSWSNISFQDFFVSDCTWDRSRTRREIPSQPWPSEPCQCHQ